MAVEIIGIDHIYVAVRDLARSERFYDVVMDILGFRKSKSQIAEAPHIHYYNRQFGFSLRPAWQDTPDHNPYGPGIHHFCFRVEGEQEVDEAARALRATGVEATPPAYYSEYAADYYASFFSDPDGVRLEITNFRAERRRRMHDWSNEDEGSS